MARSAQNQARREQNQPDWKRPVVPPGIGASVSGLVVTQLPDGRYEVRLAHQVGGADDLDDLQRTIRHMEDLWYEGLHQ